MQTVIEKMVFGGAALARTEQGVVFIDGALPGEKIEYVIESKQQGVLTGKLQSVLEKSDRRRHPNCQYYDRCGGCGWLHIDPQYQTDLKKDIFIDCLSRIGKLKSIPEVSLYNSPETGYRIRAQLKNDNKGNYGFFRKKSNDFVRIDYCPLLADGCNNVLEILNKSGRVISSDVIKIIAGSGSVASEPLIAGVTSSDTLIRVNQYTFKVQGGSFFQSNRFLTEIMGTWAIPYVNGDFCVDLYGGTGLFSILMNRQFTKGLLVESVNSQVETARYNFEMNSCKHCSAVCADAAALKRVVKSKPDILIVDPPRTGLDKDVRKSILDLSPGQIVYISCNPSTQARDVSVFVNAGYVITNAALFDCYPNTFHIETGLILKKL